MKQIVKLITWSIIFLAATIFLSCEEGPKTETILMRVNHYVQPTKQFEPTLNVQVFFVQQDNKIGSTEWQSFSASIAGFDFEPGYTYDLVVESEE